MLGWEGLNCREKGWRGLISDSEVSTEMQRIELFLTRVQNSLILIRARFQGILARVWMVRVGQEVEK
jgi:hypothetical protein